VPFSAGSRPLLGQYLNLFAEPVCWTHRERLCGAPWAAGDSGSLIVRASRLNFSSTYRSGAQLFDLADPLSQRDQPFSARDSTTLTRSVSFRS